METLVQLMIDFDLMYDSTKYNRCPAPKPESYGITWEEYQAYQENGSISNPGLEDFLADREACLSFHPAGGLSIPSHKLSSNEGWIIRPFEINCTLNQLVRDTIISIDEILEYTPNIRSDFNRMRLFLEKSEIDGGFIVW